MRYIVAEIAHSIRCICHSSPDITPLSQESFNVFYNNIVCPDPALCPSVHIMSCFTAIDTYGQVICEILDHKLTLFFIQQQGIRCGSKQSFFGKFFFYFLCQVCNYVIIQKRFPSVIIDDKIIILSYMLSCAYEIKNTVCRLSAHVGLGLVFPFIAVCTFHITCVRNPNIKQHI